MEIIPVIDVKHGRAVRAVRGERSSYKPLESPLAKSADPVDVARGYQRLFPFRTLYVADLGGIEGRGANFVMQQQVAEAWDGEVWVDDGSVDLPNTSAERIRYVLGSESLTAGVPHDARESRDWVLSLDFRRDEFQGSLSILEDVEAWPDRVIVMTLARVGSNEGPDLALLKSIIERADGREVFAAGGVRGPDDLLALRDAGAAGVLIASSLHDGKIKTGDLEEIAG